MDLSFKKKIASQLFKCSKKRVKFDTERLDEIKEAITKDDIRGLISDNALIKTQKKGVSRARAKKRQEQRRAGKRRGHGKRKGKATARLPKKDAWMAKIRAQRKFLAELKEKGLVDNKTYRMLYLKSKGGFFRSRRHIKLYITEHKLVKESQKPKGSQSKS